MHKFRYLSDPLFLFATLTYALNRCVAVPLWGNKAPFLINHLGDVLLIPCALPILLWLQKITRLRSNDLPPTITEVVSTLALWAFLFEWLFPRVAGRGVSDPLDVIAYAFGALIAGVVWNRSQVSHRALRRADSRRNFSALSE